MKAQPLHPSYNHARRDRVLLAIGICAFSQVLAGWTQPQPDITASAPARCCISESAPYRAADATLSRKRFDLYHKLGVNIIRTELVWREMEPRAGEWLDEYHLNHIKLAQQAGFRLKMNVCTLSAPPAWFLDAHPDAKIINEFGDWSHNTLSLWYPALHQIIEQITDRLFQYMAEGGLFTNLAFIAPDFGPASEPLYPAVWTMGPHYTHGPTFWCYDANAQADFRTKMRAKYGDIATANARWQSEFKNWSEVSIPPPKKRPGLFWEDVLTWYRDTKREFVLWQIRNYRTHMAKYKIQNVPVLLYVPGFHITEEEWAAAIRSGAGAKNIRSMCDSEFLLETARHENCWLQYTGSECEAEVAYLTGYMQQHNFSIPMWGENAGGPIESTVPSHLANVILKYGLYGLDYVHSYYVFEKDGLSPNAIFPQLKASYSRIQRGRPSSVLKGE